ncbi:MAG TPA: hypothetical protein IAB13_04250 [Candidatus Avanaerovorax faecigallinarum]|nr:hypothetical protein [Candidatus Avanaerovorax faecigallinarum]
MREPECPIEYDLLKLKPKVASAFFLTLKATFELAEKEVDFIWFKDIFIPGSPETDCPV